MAGTVEPLVYLFSGLTYPSNCDQIADWSGSPTLDTEIKIQGGGALSKKVSNTTSIHVFSLSEAKDLSDTILYIWILGGSKAQFDTQTNGGIRIRIEDGSANWGEWYVAGKDFGYEGGWQCLAVRTTSTTRYYTSATAPNKLAITKVGIVFKTIATAAKINCWWDALRYGTGLRLKAGTESSPAALEDFVTYEEIIDNKWGVIVKSEGILFAQGKLYLGSPTAGESTYFKDESTPIAFRDRDFGDFYDIILEGNSTASTKIFFGSAIGEEPTAVGVSGCIFLSAGASKYKFTATNQYITELGVYGCIFLNADTISFPPYSPSKKILSSSFEKCAKILPDTCLIRYCKFISANNIAVEISSTSHAITDSSFINNPRAIETIIAETLAYLRLIFSGNDYVTLNSSGSPITVNLTDCEADTWNFDPAGSAVNYVATAMHELTGLKQYTEVTYVDVATGNDIFKVEVSESGVTQYNYGSSIFGKTVDIHIHHIEYVPILIAGVVLTAAGGSIPVTQYIDRVYSNP